MFGKKCTAELLIELILDMHDFERVSKQKSFNLINFYHICGDDKEYAKYKSKNFEEFEFLNDVLTTKRKRYRGR